jgi:hypothetical protein
LKKFFLLFLILPLASQELVDVLWGKTNLNKPFTYNQLQEYINNGSFIDHSINGTISLGEVLGNGFTLIKDENNFFKEFHKDLPHFSLEIVEKDGEIIPSNTGLISTNHPLWNIQFGEGKGYFDENLNVSVILLPFSLMHKNANCVHTGISMFSLDKQKKSSNVIFQVASETCSYYKFDYVSIYKGQFAGLPDKNIEQSKNISNAVEKKSFEELYDVYNIKANSFADSRYFSAENVTIFGLIDGKKHYQSVCNTRLGTNIFCDQIVLPSYSLAKSVAGTLSLSLINDAFEDISQYNVSDLIPECNKKKWSDVTLENLSDMSTGQYFSTNFDYDESSLATTNFLFRADSHKQKVKIACNSFPRKKRPGKSFIYHTTDTYLLGVALNSYLINNTSYSDYFNDVLVPFLEEYNFSSVSKSSLRTNDENYNALTGLGMYFSVNDLYHLSNIFHSIKNNSSKNIFLHDALNPNYSNSLEAIRSANIFYNNGFWSKVFDKNLFGCKEDIWIPFMSGFGGITFAILPNGMSYYYFSDGYVYSWNDAVIASHNMRSFC